jgi:hypothetical protein
MPRYFFNIKDGRKIISDPEGTELPDEESAREYAREVVRELTRNRENRTTSWRLAVCNEQGTPCFELLFASLVESITQLPPAARAVVEQACRNAALLNDEINHVRTTLHQLRATMAGYDTVERSEKMARYDTVERSEKAPYLVTLNGTRL